MSFPEAMGEVPERGYSFLGAAVRRPGLFPREEVEAALARYFEAGEHGESTGDWGPWASMFTEDALYVEHSMGIFRGRDAIQNWVTTATGGKPVTSKGVLQWSMIDNDLVMLYSYNQRSAPDGGEPYKFVTTSVFCYAGDGLFCYEEDLANPNEIMRTGKLWGAAMVGEQQDAR